MGGAGTYHVVVFLRRIQGVYGVFRGVLGGIHGVYTDITGVSRCKHGNKGVYRLHKGYTMMDLH